MIQSEYLIVHKVCCAKGGRKIHRRKSKSTALPYTWYSFRGYFLQRKQRKKKIMMIIISFCKLLAATLTILITTLDDCVWLVPFVAKRKTALCHGSLFVATLTGMAILVSGITCWFSSRLAVSRTILEVSGALFCWLLAGYLLYRSVQRRRRHQHQLFQRDKEEETPIIASSNLPFYESTSTTSVPDDDTAQPWMIVTLTFVGSIDEIMYFPGLLLGHLFTAWELCLGAFLAACIMLIVVMTCLRQCKPLVDWLDHIPLYVVVAIFAVVMTAEVVQELYWTPE